MEFNCEGFFKAVRKEKENKWALDIIEEDKLKDDMNWETYKNDSDLSDAINIGLDRSVKDKPKISNIKIEYTKLLLSNPGFMGTIVKNNNYLSDPEDVAIFINNIINNLQ